jgi:hypothetical protein
MSDSVWVPGPINLWPRHRLLVAEITVCPLPAVLVLVSCAPLPALGTGSGLSLDNGPGAIFRTLMLIGAHAH